MLGLAPLGLLPLGLDVEEPPAGDVSLAASGAAVASGSATIESSGGTNIGLAGAGAAVASGSATISSSGGTVQIVIPVLREVSITTNRTDETGVTVRINDAVTGDVVATFTGQSFSASGCIVTHASFVAGHRYDIKAKMSDGWLAYGELEATLA